MAVTEEEWLHCNSSYSMLSAFQGLLGDCRRKCRLVAVACCRQIAQARSDRHLEDLFTAIEKLADGQISEDDYRAIQAHCETVLLSEDRRSGLPDDEVSASWVARHLRHLPSYCRRDGPVADFFWCIRDAASRSQADPNSKEWERDQCALVREIIGNPFRPVSVAPAWLSATVTALARRIYDDRRFNDMPILGDALEDAGCHDQDILNHCRQPTDHALGCWVIDLLLGNEPCIAINELDGIPEGMDLNAFLRETVEPLRQTLPWQAHHTLTLDLEPSLAPVRLRASDRKEVFAQQLTQAMRWLLENSIEAMPNGGTVLIMTRNACLDAGDAARLMMHTGPCVRLSVADTGCGMDEQTRTKCLEPFFSTKGRTGLGLALSQGTLRSVFSGAIEAVGKCDSGSVFRIYLPVMK
jgi:hypothetical protein